VFIEVIRAEHVIKKLVAVIRTARGLKKLNPFKNGARRLKGCRLKRVHCEF
jgi:hypothetical protein